MIFALGFLSAGLVALAFAPAFWRRALRLTRRRLETQVPLSAEEILAERDQLRAEFAVERRRIEQRAARVNRAHAADRSELGRRAAEIGALKGELERHAEENRALELALGRARSELESAYAQLGALNKALYDAHGLYETTREELVKLARRHDSATLLAEERLANHASADARAAGLELRLGDVSRMLLEAEKRFTERTAQAAKLSDSLANATRNLALSESNYAALQRRLEVETARSTQVAQELEALRRQRDEDQAKIRTLAAKLGADEAALEAASEREKKSRMQRDELVEKARAAKRGVDEKYDRLQAEYAALQGALETARKRVEALEAEQRRLKNLGEERAADKESPRLARNGAENGNGAEEPDQARAEPHLAEADPAGGKHDVRDQVTT